MFLGSCASLPIKIVPILYAWSKPETAERIFFTIRQHSEAQTWPAVLFTFVHKDMCSRFYCLQSLLCMLTHVGSKIKFIFDNFKAVEVMAIQGRRFRPVFLVTIAISVQAMTICELFFSFQLRIKQSARAYAYIYIYIYIHTYIHT
jgi:hypothetical protein